MARSLTRLVVATIALFIFAGCATTTGWVTEQSDLQTQSDAALARAQRNDPGFADTILNSAGYAVFPMASDGIGLSESYGKGVLYEYGTAVGFCDLDRASAAPQSRPTTSTRIIVFRTEEAVYEFKNSGVASDAQASLAAYRSSDAARVTRTGDVSVFAADQTGRMRETSGNRQEFTFHGIDRTAVATRR